MEKVDYYGIKLSLPDTEEFLNACSDFVTENSNKLVFFINAHCFNIAQKNTDYKNALNSCDVLLNDGIGIKIGALIKGINLKENMNGTDLVPKIMAWSRDKKIKVYLLGSEGDIAFKAKAQLEERFPGISIVGYRNGFFDFDDDQEILDDIIKKGTELLIVGMGVPRQEMWLIKNQDKLTNVKISIAAGAVLDFISGKVYRAPLWMQKAGIEWLFRLLQEPARLFKRYFIGIPVFFYYLLKSK